MAVTRERFEQGLTYAAYKAQMTRNRERFEANEQLVTLDEGSVAVFRQLPGRLHVLVLAEDWCGDVINNLPVLGKLAAASDRLNIRIFLRDQNLDIMEQYLKDGQHHSIPVFVFFDEDFREIGHWIERPAKVAALMAEMRHNLFSNDPLLASFAPDTSPAQLPDEARARLMQAFGAFREETRIFSDSEVVRELRELVTRGLGKLTGTPAPITTGTPLPFTKPRPRAAKPVKVKITYCAACGYEPQTLDLTAALMKEFLYDLSAIELIPWQDGAFDVVVNDDLIHSMYRDGGFPTNEQIISAVRERLAA